jgi:hypothetical protein
MMVQVGGGQGQKRWLELGRDVVEIMGAATLRVAGTGSLTDLEAQ